MSIRVSPKGAVLALALATAAPPVAAGDFAEFCSSADGAYGLEFQGQGAALLLARVPGDPNAAPRQIPARIVSETILLNREGYCVDDRAPQTRYGLSTLISAVTVAYETGGATRRVSLICETHSAGVPAAATCSGDTITSQSGLHAP